MATISLKHKDFVPIFIVVIKPAGPDDGIGMTTGSYSDARHVLFPVMEPQCLIPGAESFSHANRGH